MQTCPSAFCIEAEDGAIIMEEEKLIERRKEHISEPYESNRPPEYLVTKREEEHLPILQREIVKTIKCILKG